MDTRNSSPSCSDRFKNWFRQMHCKQVLVHFSLVAWASCAVAQTNPDLNPNPEFSRPSQPSPPVEKAPPISQPPAPGESSPSLSGHRADDEELAKKLYQARVEQAFLEKPHLYESMRRVAGSPSPAMVEVERSALDKRKQEEIDARNSPTVSVQYGTPMADISGLKLQTTIDYQNKDMALHAQQERRARENDRVLTDISSERGVQQFKSLAQKITNLEYRQKAGDKLTESEKLQLQHFDSSIKSNSDRIPKTAGSAAALVAADPSLGQTLERAGYAPSDIRQVLSGTKTLKDIDNPQAANNLALILNKYTVSQTVTAKTAVQILQSKESQKTPELDLLNRRLIETENRLRETAKLPKADIGALTRVRDGIKEKIREVRLEEHEAEVKKNREYGDAAFSVAALFTKSPDVQKAWQGYTASTNIYNAVGRALINGAIDPTGISAIAGGIGTLTALFGSHDDANAAVMGMLKEILENQRKILEQLKAIDAKIDTINQKLNQIISSLEEGKALTQAGVAEIQATLARYAATAEDIARTNAIVGLEQKTIDESKVDLAFLDSSARRSEYERCLSIGECTNLDVLATIDTLEKDAIRVKYAALLSLGRDPYYRPVNVNELPIADLQVQRGTDVAKRNGHLASAQEFLNSKITEGSIFSRGNPEILAGQPPADSLTSVFIPTYVDLITHLPATGNRKADIVDLRRKLESLGLATREMRKNTHLAKEVFTNAAIGLLLRLNQQLYNLAAESNFEEIVTREPKSYFDQYPPAIEGYVKGLSNWLPKEELFGPSLYMSRIVDLQVTLEAMAGRQDLPVYYQMSPPVPHGSDWYVTQKQEVPDKIDPKKSHTITTTKKGLRFAGYSLEEVRDFIHNLKEGQFARFGEEVGAFKVTHEEIKKGLEAANTQGIMTKAYVTNTLAIEPSDKAIEYLVQNRKVGPAGESSYAIGQLVRFWQFTYGGKVPEWYGAKFSLPNADTGNRKAWENLLVSYVQYTQNKIFTEFKSRIQEGVSTSNTDRQFQSLLRDTVRSALVLDTFLHAGAGECLDIMAEFRGARQVLTLSRNIADRATGIEKAFNLQELFEAEVDIIRLIEKIKAISLPDMERLEYSASCKLGWGDIDQARQELDRAIAYDTAPSSAPLAPR
ncbi:hypothetical protein [Bradyrhizobium sp. RT5a]|uniref:hypothetical protein n=1 Tax=Bradyrhizobium sp. RT5a TaxID=3156380 RepID=UPI00339AF216